MVDKSCLRKTEPVSRCVDVAESGTFLAGMVITMLIVDVTKLMVGRLSPVFLEVCDVNRTVCFSQDQPCNADDVCIQSDSDLLRWARCGRVQ